MLIESIFSIVGIVVSALGTVVGVGGMVVDLVGVFVDVVGVVFVADGFVIYMFSVGDDVVVVESHRVAVRVDVVPCTVLGLVGGVGVVVVGVVIGWVYASGFVDV